MDSLISRIPELQKTICDEIESFSVVGYQAFESGKKIQNCFVVVNIYLKHLLTLWISATWRDSIESGKKI